ncbi:MAG: hypothetical protein HN981_00625 [Candidatus Pacebacteria bacterium]|jgi:hypothetical protein|nr:hypothetical protein [Candidatus Paceibacterota bacterium]MBT6756036.1 hypothetical protein [Candidatus Paceibacterota bacterium]MBT6920888.1 hypothetical protein [Candidatus Paceibacterota bacterium]
MKQIERNTRNLVEDLFDKQMKENILQYLFWVTMTESLQAVIDFIDFLKIPDVENILREMNNRLFTEVIDISHGMKRKAELLEL